MSPQPKRDGTYCFWCGSRQRPRSFVSVLNQWVDFDQTCIDTLLGGRKELGYILVTLTLFSRSNQHFEMSNFDQNRVSVYLMILAKLEKMTIKSSNISLPILF